MTRIPFSKQLHNWLKSDGTKTLDQLEHVFAEKSIAIGILILMFVPALPIPTGGITHIFEIIAMLLSLELIAGRTTIWLPKKWRTKSLGKLAQKKVLPAMGRYIEWFEKFSRPRFRQMLRNHHSLRAIGLVSLLFCIFAFLAPPFSGLDTLPALGVVVLMLSVILEDGLLTIIGLIIGVVGSGIIIGFGTAIIETVKRLF